MATAADKVVVAVRMREAKPEEGAPCLRMTDDACELQMPAKDGGPSGARQLFRYDHCFWSSEKYASGNPVASHAAQESEAASQGGIYTRLGLHVLNHVTSGHNACLIAYGATGSGKSHTVFGPSLLAPARPQTASSDSDRGGGDDPERRADDEPNGNDDDGSDALVSDDAGVVPRMVRDLLDEAQSTCRREGSDAAASVRISVIEVLHERVYDLVTSDRKELAVHETKASKNGAAGGSFVAEGAEKPLVRTAAEARTLLRSSLARRTVASHAANDVSSRAHTLVTLEFRRRVGPGRYRCSRATIADLAGNERVAVAKTLETKELLKQATAINLSLLTLGTCINVIVARMKANLPQGTVTQFRNSTLTKLLKDSIAGNSHLSLLCTVAPGRAVAGQTLHTLRFADGAKHLECRHLALANVQRDDPAGVAIAGAAADGELPELSAARAAVGVAAGRNRKFAMAAQVVRRLLGVYERQERTHRQSIAVEQAQSWAVIVARAKVFFAPVSRDLARHRLYAAPAPPKRKPSAKGPAPRTNTHALPPLNPKPPADPAPRNKPAARRVTVAGPSPSAAKPKGTTTATATATATTTTTTYRIGPDGKKHVVDTTTTTTTTAGGVGKSTKQQTTTTKTQMMSRNPALDRVQAGLRREQQRAAAAKLERVQQDEHKGRGGIVAAEARVRSRLVSGEREIATKLIAALRRREAAGGDELQWHVRNAKATSSSTASIAASAPKFAALRAVWNAAAGNGDGAMKFSAVAAACEAAGFLRVSVVTTTEMSPANGVATNNTAGAAAVAASAPASEAYSSDLDDDDARSLPSPSPEPAAASSVAASSIPPTPSPVATRSPTPASVGPKSTPPRSPTASLPATPRSEIDGASVPATPASSIPPTPVSSAAPGTRSPLPLRSSPPRSPRSPTPASDAEAGYSDDDFEEAASPASASPPPPPPPKPEEHPPEGAASAVALQDLADPDEVRRRVEAEEAERAAREAAERARKAALVAPASDEVRPVAPVEGSEAVLEAAVLVVSIETADAIRKLAACIDELAVGAAAVTIDAEAEEQLRAAVSTTLGPLEPPGTDFVDAVVALLAALASLRCSGNPAAPSPIAEWCADDEWLDASLLNEQATSADARPLATVLRLISGATDVHRSATTEWGAALARRLANAPVHAESAAGGANRDAVRALLLGVPSPCAVVGSAVWNDDTASAWIAAARRLALAVPHTTDAERCTVCAACTTLRQRLGAAHHDEWNSQLCGANGHADIK